MFEESERSYTLLSWSLDPKEQNLTDREVDIYDTFLSTDDLLSLRSQHLKDYELGQDNFHVCQFGLIKIFTPQVY
jgi:hypothetical protein